MWEVEYTDEFGSWWDTLDEGEQTDVAACVAILEMKGSSLDYPYSSKTNGSDYTHMRVIKQG